MDCTKLALKMFPAALMKTKQGHWTDDYRGTLSYSNVRFPFLIRYKTTNTMLFIFASDHDDGGDIRIEQCKCLIDMFENDLGTDIQVVRSFFERTKIDNALISEHTIFEQNIMDLYALERRTTHRAEATGKFDNYIEELFGDRVHRGMQGVFIETVSEPDRMLSTGNTSDHYEMLVEALLEREGKEGLSFAEIRAMISEFAKLDPYEQEDVMTNVVRYRRVGIRSDGDISTRRYFHEDFN